jgi:putative oxidoreductase
MLATSVHLGSDGCKIGKEIRMATLSIVIAFGVRSLLVMLFLPFSALDKVLDFKDAVRQADQATSSLFLATALIVLGIFVEVVMSVGVLTGIADRAAAFVLAGYCGTTALLWKQFWRPGDFWARGDSRARDQFWDFLKNFALAGGFLLVTFGTSADTVGNFFAYPFSSTHPYQIANEVRP